MSVTIHSTTTYTNANLTYDSTATASHSIADTALFALSRLGVVAERGGGSRRTSL